MQKRILIFEDDVDTAEVCRIICEGLGMEVFNIPHTQDVLRDVQNFTPQVILMDILLPGIGGPASIAKIKHTKGMENIPVILFSAGNQSEEIAKNCGADAFLEKPFDVIALEEIIINVLTEQY